MRRKSYQELTFTDDFMFCKVLEDDTDLCRRILELILGVKIREVRFKNAQQVIAPQPDKKSIRLDIILDDADGTIYDLEMQTQHRRDLAKRTRCYQGVIDVDTLSRGGRYSDLPGGYIVFICTFDPFGRGIHKYTFRERCDEDASVYLNDETWKVFVNAKSAESSVSAEMRAFLDYLCGREPASDLTSEIDNLINYAKNNKVWEIEYMQFMDYWVDVADDARDEGREEGLAEGREEGLAQGREEGLAQGREEGLAEGREEGLAQGREEGEALLAELIQKLTESGRFEDIGKAATDTAYRKQLYMELGITYVSSTTEQDA